MTFMLDKVPTPKVVQLGTKVALLLLLSDFVCASHAVSNPKYKHFEFQCFRVFCHGVHLISSGYGMFHDHEMS